MEPTVKQPYHPANCPVCGLRTEVLIPFCKQCKFDLRYGTVGKPKRGKCIYCDNNDLTDEHIFPEWLGSIYPRRFQKTAHTLRRPERHVFFEHSEMHPETKQHYHDPYTTKVRNVCAECNNGWMSKLQNEAKDIVIAFANGAWRPLSDSERDIISRWAVMVSLNLECYARMLTTNEYQRQVLKSGSVPNGWRVYIGLFENLSNAGMSYHGSVGIPIHVGEDDFIRLQNSLFCIEHAVFHTLSSANNHFLELAKYGAVRLQESSDLSFIWPLTETMKPKFEEPLKRDYVKELMSYTYV